MSHLDKDVKDELNKHAAEAKHEVKHPEVVDMMLQAVEGLGPTASVQDKQRVVNATVGSIGETLIAKGATTEEIFHSLGSLVKHSGAIVKAIDGKK